MSAGDSREPRARPDADARGDDRAHVLAADVGGTHARLLLLRIAGAGGAQDARDGEVVASHTAACAEADALEDILTAFLDSAGRPGLAAACLGIAGPVLAERALLTNLPWRVDAAALRRRLGCPRVRLVNDLEATAFGMLRLPPDRFEVLQPGTRPRGSGNVVVPAAGTGFGLAALVWDGTRHHTLASEGGHVGYAPRTAREIALLRHLERRHGRVSLERVVSGPGLRAIHDFLRGESGAEAPRGLAERMAEGDPSAEIARAALAGEDAVCAEALSLFVSSYGAAAGDAALTHLATGGVWIGGGIAPRILPALREGGFLEAFRDKGRFRPLLESLHVAVCLEPDTALNGAAALALREARS